MYAFAMTTLTCTAILTQIFTGFSIENHHHRETVLMMIIFSNLYLKSKRPLSKSAIIPSSIPPPPLSLFLS